jgi:hypothetical protein
VSLLEAKTHVETQTRQIYLTTPFVHFQQINQHGGEVVAGSLSIKMPALLEGLPQTPMSSTFSIGSWWGGLSWSRSIKNTSDAC